MASASLYISHSSSTHLVGLVVGLVDLGLLDLWLVRLVDFRLVNLWLVRLVDFWLVDLGLLRLQTIAYMHTSDNGTTNIQRPHMQLTQYAVNTYTEHNTSDSATQLGCQAGRQ